MATSQLEIYNGALLLCKQRFLASTSEEVEARRLLDHVWDSRGREACLEQAGWNFAIRTIELASDPAIGPDFGYQSGFTRPTDFITLVELSQDEYFTYPLTRFKDEAQIWYADQDPIYVSYVSDDPAYGLNMANWPESFTNYVKAYFAGQIVLKLTGVEPKVVEFLHGPPGHPRRGWVERKLREAKSKDARLDTVKFPKPGSWNLARWGRKRGDRGNTGSLIG